MRSVPSGNGLSSFSAPYPFEKTKRCRFCTFVVCACVRVPVSDISKRASMFEIEYIVCDFGK